MRSLPLLYTTVLDAEFRASDIRTEGWLKYRETTLSLNGGKLVLWQSYWGLLVPNLRCLLLFQYDGPTEPENLSSDGMLSEPDNLSTESKSPDHQGTCAPDGELRLARCFFLPGASVEMKTPNDFEQAVEVILELASLECERSTQVAIDFTTLPHAGKKTDLSTQKSFLLDSEEDAAQWCLMLESCAACPCAIDVVGPPCAVEHRIRLFDPVERRSSDNFGVRRLSADMHDVLRRSCRVSFQDIDDSTLVPLRNQLRTNQVLPLLGRPQLNLYMQPYDARDYQMLGYLGKGGQGVVMLATRLSDNTQVALKRILRRDDQCGQLLNEVSLLTSCDHAYILKILGFHFVGVRKHHNVSYREYILVMEYLEGGPLTNVVYPQAGRETMILTEQQIATITHTVAITLAYLHENGCAHRDLKTDNILCALDGTIKLADFGHAERVISGVGTTSSCGTELWMAPEILCRDRTLGTVSPYDAKKIDVWSLGIVFLELCDGRPPNANQPKRIQHLNGQEFSKLAFEFAEFVLVEDPKLRPTMEQVLKHPFLGEENRHYNSAFLADFLKRQQERR